MSHALGGKADSSIAGMATFSMSFQLFAVKLNITTGAAKTLVGMSACWLQQEEGNWIFLWASVPVGRNRGRVIRLDTAWTTRSQPMRAVSALQPYITQVCG